MSLLNCLLLNGNIEVGMTGVTHIQAGTRGVSQDEKLSGGEGPYPVLKKSPKNV